MAGDSFAQTMPMNPCCIPWYGWGLVHGGEARDADYLAHEKALHHAAFEVVQQMASLPTHAELEQQRNTYTRPEWADAS